MGLLRQNADGVYKRLSGVRIGSSILLPTSMDLRAYMEEVQTLRSGGQPHGGLEQ